MDGRRIQRSNYRDQRSRRSESGGASLLVASRMLRQSLLALLLTSLIDESVEIGIAPGRIRHLVVDHAQFRLSRERVVDLEEVALRLLRSHGHRSQHVLFGEFGRHVREEVDLGLGRRRSLLALLPSELLDLALHNHLLIPVRFTPTVADGSVCCSSCSHGMGCKGRRVVVRLAHERHAVVRTTGGCSRLDLERQFADVVALLTEADCTLRQREQRREQPTDAAADQPQHHTCSQGGEGGGAGRPVETVPSTGMEWMGEEDPREERMSGQRP
ncbi:hypothetical protein PENTCL1PPCAC_25030, partial [Pristionchus entomophagus]